jgi:hypothetical protein
MRTRRHVPHAAHRPAAIRCNMNGFWSWAASSAGRAPRSQRGGREFEPPAVHQVKTPANHSNPHQIGPLAAAGVWGCDTTPGADAPSHRATRRAGLATPPAVDRPVDVAANARISRSTSVSFDRTIGWCSSGRVPHGPSLLPDQRLSRRRRCRGARGCQRRSRTKKDASARRLGGHGFQRSSRQVGLPVDLVPDAKVLLTVNGYNLVFVVRPDGFADRDEPRYFTSFDCLKDQAHPFEYQRFDGFAFESSVGPLAFTFPDGTAPAPQSASALDLRSWAGPDSNWFCEAVTPELLPGLYVRPTSAPMGTFGFTPSVWSSNSARFASRRYDPGLSGALTLDTADAVGPA